MLAGFTIRIPLSTTVDFTGAVRKAREQSVQTDIYPDGRLPNCAWHAKVTLRSGAIVAERGTATHNHNLALMGRLQENQGIGWLIEQLSSQDLAAEEAEMRLRDASYRHCNFPGSPHLATAIWQNLPRKWLISIGASWTSPTMIVTILRTVLDILQPPRYLILPLSHRHFIYREVAAAVNETIRPVSLTPLQVFNALTSLQKIRWVWEDYVHHICDTWNWGSSRGTFTT